MKRFLSFFLFLTAFATIANAQEPVFGATDEFNSTWTMSVDKTTDLQVGDVITFRFTGNPIGTWHLYSANASGNISYNPTNMEIFENEGKGAKLKGGTSESKKPHEEEDELMGGTIRHFDDGESVTFTQKVEITATDIDMVAQFNAQICQSTGSCVFARFPVTWKTTAKKPKDDSAIITPEKNPKENNNPEKDPATTPEKDPENDPETEVVEVDTANPSTNFNMSMGGGNAGMEGAALANFPCEQIYFEPYKDESIVGCDAGTLFSLFFQAFVFGLFAIFTPCVFPIIPMTVSFFTKQSKTRQQGIRNGIIYSISIVLIYVVLGLLLTALFGPTFLYKFSTHWVTNVIFFILLVVFALSFFGWFEITLPSSWSTKINKGSDRGGMIGIFFMALTLVIVSFSCTGPIIGTVLIAAGSESEACTIMPIVGMAGFAIAMAIPFGMFAMFPGWLNSMPTAGGWLNSVKVVLGFIELALGMKFLSTADLINRWHILDRDVFLGIWIVIFIMMGLYLLGKIRLPHDAPMDSIKVPRFMLAMMTFCFAIYLLPGMFGKPLNTLEGIIPPITSNIGVNVRGGVARPVKHCPVEEPNWSEYFDNSHEGNSCWFYDYCEAADYAQRVGKPLFIDFTGHSCANCRKMEQAVFSNEIVSRYFEEDYVLVSLWVDDVTRLEEPYVNEKGEKLRTIGDVLLDFEKEKYGSPAQPYYVLVGVESDTAKVLAKPQGFDESYNAVAFAKYLEDGVVTYESEYKEKK